MRKTLLWCESYLYIFSEKMKIRYSTIPFFVGLIALLPFNTAFASVPQSLTLSDFVVTLGEEDEDLLPYNNNVLEYQYAIGGDPETNGGTAQVLNWGYIDEDSIKEDVVVTNRGIHLGSPLSSVEEEYGLSLAFAVNEESDEYKIIGSGEEGGEERARKFLNDVKYGLTYAFQNQDGSRYGTIIFFFDENNKVSWIWMSNDAFGLVTNYDKEFAKMVQEQLNEQGYNCGTPDGISGANTLTALGKFQGDKGLPVNYIMDYRTLCELLGEDNAATYLRNRNADLISSNVTIDIAMTEASSENTGDDVAIPDGIDLDEKHWDDWKSTSKCSIWNFMDAADQIGFSFSLPSGQEENHKTGQFFFIEGDNHRKYEDAEFYYGMEGQLVKYMGLWTDNIDVYNSHDFREACILSLLGYNSTFSDDGAILNLTRERAEEIVD